MDTNPARVQKLNQLAVASLVLGLAGIVTIPVPLIPSCAVGLIGVLFGFIALWQIPRRGGRPADWVLAFLGILTGLVPAAGWCAFIYTLTYALLKGMQVH